MDSEPTEMTLEDEDLLLSDDLSPNDGSAFLPEEEPEQVQEDNAERAMVQGAGAHLIDTLLEWMDDEITAANTLDGIDLESPVSHIDQLLARKILVAKFRDAKQRLENLKDSHIK